ncbi:hypothetical protein HDU92_009199, partial [Lobulomyces angularis]
SLAKSISSTTIHTQKEQSCSSSNDNLIIPKLTTASQLPIENVNKTLDHQSSHFVTVFHDENLNPVVDEYDVFNEFSLERSHELQDSEMIFLSQLKGATSSTGLDSKQPITKNTPIIPRITTPTFTSHTDQSKPHQYQYYIQEKNQDLANSASHSFSNIKLEANNLDYLTDSISDNFSSPSSSILNLNSPIIDINSKLTNLTWGNPPIDRFVDFNALQQQSQVPLQQQQQHLSLDVSGNNHGLLYHQQLENEREFFKQFFENEDTSGNNNQYDNRNNSNVLLSPLQQQHLDIPDQQNLRSVLFPVPSSSIKSPYYFPGSQQQQPNVLTNVLYENSQFGKDSSSCDVIQTQSPIKLELSPTTTILTPPTSPPDQTFLSSSVLSQDINSNNKQTFYRKWTKEEDNLLLMGVEEYGSNGNWNKIAENLDRTAMQCSTRYIL